MARIREVHIAIVVGVAGREDTEVDTLLSILYEWGSAQGLEPYRGSGTSAVRDLFMLNPLPRRWTSLANNIIDVWTSFDVDYVVFSDSDNDIGILAINKRWTNRDALISKQIECLEVVIAAYNEKERCIQAGAASIEEVDSFSPSEFESYIAELFRREGCSASMTSKSGDTGIDIILRKGNWKGVVQCKKWKKNVGQPVLRDLYGAMRHERASEAYLVTTSGFTKAAVVFCEGKPIQLIGRFELMEWIGRKG